jgi:hypothetical protein
MAVITKRAIASGGAEALRTAAGVTTGLLLWGVFTVVGLAAVLAAPAEAYVPGVPVDERRFRPNLLVRTPPGNPARARGAPPARDGPQ